MLILNADDIRRALPMTDAIEAMRQAFVALTERRAVVPHRIHLAVPRHAGVSLIMPSFVDAEEPAAQALAVKVVSLFDHNQARGLARIQAAVIVLEPDTGRPMALLEGATLTAIRTAAASGAATEGLARRDSQTLAIIGAGVQARTHLQAVCAVRPIRQIRVFSRTRSKVATLLQEFAETPGLAADMIAVNSVREALRGADIICATTTSRTPVFDDSDVSPGAHINAVGSYTPQAREIPGETVARAAVYVDSREAAWSEAGDLIQPLEAGLITRDHVRAELGELISHPELGRTSDAQITFFKSVGIAVQDAMAAQCALRNAAKLGLGTTVPW
jgi:alanine dehydrogenase